MITLKQIIYYKAIFDIIATIFQKKYFQEMLVTKNKEFFYK